MSIFVGGHSATSSRDLIATGSALNPAPRDRNRFKPAIKLIQGHTRYQLFRSATPAPQMTVVMRREIVDLVRMQIEIEYVTRGSNNMKQLLLSVFPKADFLFDNS